MGCIPDAFQFSPSWSRQTRMGIRSRNSGTSHPASRRNREVYGMFMHFAHSCLQETSSIKMGLKNSGSALETPRLPRLTQAPRRLDLLHDLLLAADLLAHLRHPWGRPVSRQGCFNMFYHQPSSQLGSAFGSGSILSSIAILGGA